MNNICMTEDRLDNLKSNWENFFDKNKKIHKYRKQFIKKITTRF